MIVKNEAPVIRRCLDSVRPLIDAWLIVDTGSTDGTQDIVRSFFHDIPGRLVERPWLNFAHNRSEALALARELGAYSLIIDADDKLVIAEDFRLPELVADSYALDIVFGAIRYRRPHLVSNALPWRYEGVIHEFLSLPDPHGKEVRSSQSLDQQVLQGVEIHIGEDGARRRTDDSSRFRRDASVIENALRDERDPFLISRYTFYLAQSYEQAGEAELALDAYLRRAEQGFWRDEVFMSLYRAAMIMERIGRPDDDVLKALDRASSAHPQRAEAHFSASRLCRRLGRFAKGYEYASRGLRVERLADGLFVVPWIYDYGLLDELSVNAFWCGEYSDSLRASRRLLREGLFPARETERVKANYRFSLDKLLPKPERHSDTPTRQSETSSEDLLARAHTKRTEAASPDDVVSAFRTAIAADCGNLTAYHDAARYCREQDLFELGYHFAQDGLARLDPDRPTGNASAIVRYCLHDEFAVNAYWSGRYLDCMLACRVILAREDLDDRLRSRVADNLRFAQERLGLPSPDGGSALEALKAGQVSIVLATPADYPHWRALDDIADTLTSGFRRLGLLARRVTSSIDASGLCIVLGAHLRGSFEPSSDLPEDAIIFNTEHHSSHWIQNNPDYRALLKAREVWDYGNSNADLLRGELGTRVTYVEIGFVPELRRVGISWQPPIDVLHYGSVSPRRTNALNVIGQTGLSVVSGFNVYGDVRDELIARSKVVVNVHFYEPGVVELPRISYLLANGKAVVTECAAGEDIDADLQTALCAVPYSELADACLSLATNEDRRRDLEGAAIAYSLERQQQEILRNVLLGLTMHGSP